MDDERRDHDRRGEDVRLAEEIAELLRANGDFASRVHQHDEITLLIEALEGSPKRLPSGAIERQGGLIAEVAALTKKLSNGGINIKLPVGAWVAIVVAIIAGVFQVIAAIVTASGG